MIRLVGQGSVVYWESAPFTYPSVTGCSFSSTTVNHNQGRRAKIVQMSQPDPATAHPPDWHTSGGSCFGWAVSASEDNSITVVMYGANFISPGQPAIISAIFSD